MKKYLFVLAITVSLSFNAQAEQSHGGHGGGGAAATGGGSSTGTCTKPHISKFTPAHLQTVAPGSEFSFTAFNLSKAEQIFVTVKNQPVEITAEFKDPYFLIKGKLPASLVNTAARIDVKVRAKSPHCETEGGWLLKIADK